MAQEFHYGAWLIHVILTIMWVISQYVKYNSVVHAESGSSVLVRRYSTQTEMTVAPAENKTTIAGSLIS